MSEKLGKYNRLYMDIARRVALMSHARRLNVGAVVVKDGRIISMGWNGMPSGWDNDCEHEETYVTQDAPGDDYRVVHTGILKTRPEVLHAESNAIAKLARSNDSGAGGDLFVTHSPCMECAKLIYQSGISRVFFGEHYRDRTGVDFLTRSGVEVHQVDG